MKRNRKVFGRIRLEINGAQYRIELRKNGVHIRRHHKRKVYIIGFSTLIETASGQLSLL